MIWAFIILTLAALPAVMTLLNLAFYKRLPHAADAGKQASGVSILIPARDEAEGIEAAVRAALAASEGVDVEVLVLDDHSTDDTAAIVRRLADDDPRVRLEPAPPLPGGWNGKQHACWVLAQRAEASRPTLLWIDADVRLEPGSVRRMRDALIGGRDALLSGVPRQVTGSWLEVLIVPQILLVLLGYLPMARMRDSTKPGYGAGCGQLFIADRGAYFACGGHEGIRASVHDGVDLPRQFRRGDHYTGLFDATDLAVCRMYVGAAATWRGFAKNATAGMASRAAIGPWTLLLLGGHVAPWVWLVAAGGRGWMPISAAALSAVPSVAVAVRFRQGLLAAVARPVGVAALVLLQWYARARESLGYRPSWRGRVTTR
ncbi:MAG: glycosyltransferase [Planctomycetota bacterium]